jgi:hypothetical protein
MYILHIPVRNFNKTFLTSSCNIKSDDFSKQYNYLHEVIQLEGSDIEPDICNYNQSHNSGTLFSNMMKLCV